MTKREMRKQIEDLTKRLIKLENMHAETRKADSWESLGFTPAARREYVWCGMEGNYCRACRCGSYYLFPQFGRGL